MKPLVTRKVALIALFSALYYILSFLPGIEAIGVTNVTINIEAFMASIFGRSGPYLYWKVEKSLYILRDGCCSFLVSSSNSTVGSIFTRWIFGHVG